MKNYYTEIDKAISRYENYYPWKENLLTGYVIELTGVINGNI